MIYKIHNLETHEMLPFGDTGITQQTFSISASFGKRVYIGIDPGQVHMGVATLKFGGASIFEVTFPSGQDTVERILSTSGLLDYIFSMSIPSDAESFACVEQAAYGAPYGQASLAESRTTAIIAVLGRNIVPVVVPPIRIRKSVFDNGKQRAEEYNEWKKLKPNAASALACALYALRTQNG